MVAAEFRAIVSMPDRNATQPELRCYRCGGSLAALSLPLSRLDACPGCGVELHVCRMCRHYAPTKPDACAEEDAIEVLNKTAANFCDYFVPGPGAFDGQLKRAEDAARRQLDALFGGEKKESGTDVPGDASLRAAEDLFRK